MCCRSLEEEEVVKCTSLFSGADQVQGSNLGVETTVVVSLKVVFKMSQLRSSDSHLNRRLPLSAESRPKMLKDFLTEDVNSRSLRRLTPLPRLSLQSSSSRGFFSTNPKSSTLSVDNEITLRRSRSKAASMMTSAIEAMVKVVRALPRSLSKQQSSLAIKNPSETEKKQEYGDSKMGVRIKDIIGWRSFRDMGEEEAQPLEFAPPSPIYCTTATTVSTHSTSSSSSWCESDFSSDCSPPWSRTGRDFYDHKVKQRQQCALDSKPDVCSMPRSDATREPVQTVENNLHFSRVGEELTEEDSLEKSARGFSDIGIGSERHAPWKKSKGESPVSVIDYEIGEDGEWRWYCKRSPPHVEISREQGEQDEEECEEEKEPFGAEQRAMELLNQVKAFTPGNCISCKFNEERLLLDFFKSELTEGIRFGLDIGSGDEDYGELVRRAESWVRGDCHSGPNYEWGIDGKKEAHLRDMEKGEMWSKFEEDQQQMAVEIESGIWSLLVDELLGDIFPH